MLDISAATKLLRRLLPVWREFEDYCLDAEAIGALSRVVLLQNFHLRFLSSQLYADPEATRSRLSSLSREKLATLILANFHPLAELEQLTDGVMEESIAYWNQLKPWSDRWKKHRTAPLSRIEALTEEELLGLGLISLDRFSRKMEAFWKELHSACAQTGKVKYSRFVASKSFSQTLRRAQYLSFLVSYGYAELLVHGDDVFIAANENPRSRPREETMSFPVQISREKWEDWSSES